MGLSREIKVLVVDDEEPFRRPLQMALKEMGFWVEIASRGDEAFEMIIRSGYDIVITDLKMPGSNGLELLAKIKEERIKPTVILISSYLTQSIVNEAMEYGAFKCIDKSFEIDDFLCVVREAVEAKRIEESV